MIISNIAAVVTAISAINECVTFSQWFKSLLSRNKKENQEEGDVPKLHSSLVSHSSGTEKPELQEDAVLKLQSSFQCLRDILPAMYNCTDQAECRRCEKCVAQVPELKAALCYTEDLVNNFRCYQQKVKIEGSVTSAEPGTKFFHDFIQDNFSKLIHIQQTLCNQYKLLQGMSLHQASPWFDRLARPETTSFPTEAKIFGRDDEIKKLIRMLGVSGPSRLKRKRRATCLSANNQVCGALDNSEATITSVPVLPVVGVGGVGKTTLAQIICHHPQVKEHFDVIVWICVSDSDVKGLTKAAIEQFSGKTPAKDNLNSLQADLADSLNKGRFLIILDGYWDENEEDWKRFYVPFKHVPQGSMMLVTTRSPKVADVVGTVDPFLLEGLKDDIFYKFFKLCAFGSDRSNNDPVLEWIGKQILPKLKGSPLAAKICGRLLGMSLDPAHWNKILNSQLWKLMQEEDDILPALRLSYMYLPFHLKRCFSFCAVYPKGYNFVKEDLAEIWVAEGFVESQCSISLLQTGCKYFEELAYLSFFQKLHGKYVIHDLMHDMAQLVSVDQCLRIPQTDVPTMWEPQQFASATAGTRGATSSHRDVPPMCPPLMSRRQSDTSILKVLKMVLRMNKDMSNALHREKQARKRDSKQIKRGLRHIKKLRREAGKQVSPSGSEAEELEFESEGEQYPDIDALISQVRSEQLYGQSYAPGGGHGPHGYGFGGQFHPGPSSFSALQQHQHYGQSYAPGGGGYGYGFGGQFHPGPTSSSALHQHQQFGPRDYFNAAKTGSGYGYGGRLSFTDSESSYGTEPEPPPPEGKGKAVAVDGGRHRRRRRIPGGFMAAARRSHPQEDGHP